MGSLVKTIPKLTVNDFTRFWSKVDKKGPDDCWEWIKGTDKDGYGQFWLNRSLYRAHRVSYTIKYSDPKEFCVCHHCDNPVCVNPDHLWLGTCQDNIDDCVQKDRCANLKGEETSSARLTGNQVREILESIEPQQIVADRLGVSHQTISKIKRGSRWSHIEGKRDLNIARSNSQTRVKGVDFHKVTGKYQARITYKRVRYYLGLFDTVEEAEQVLNKWKEEHGLQ